MTEKVNIPISRFEYRADYARPNIGFWLDRAVVVQAIFDALSKWQMKVDDIEPITTGRPSEQGIKFKLPDKKISMFFGAAHLTFAKDDANWASAEEIVQIITAFAQTLTQAGKVELTKQMTSVALHIQPTTKSFLDILQPFFSPALTALREDRPTTGASFIKWGDDRVVIDGSAALANGAYLLFEKAFGADVALEDIARDLHALEVELFKMLDIEENLP
jgi:hypothetical protein